MAAGACLWPNTNHRTPLRQQAMRGPGNIAGLDRRGRKVVSRAKRMANRKKAKA